MNKTTPSYTLRRFRTPIAILLACFTLLAPLSPVLAQTVKVKRVLTPQGAGAQQPAKGKSGGTIGGVKQLTLPATNVVAAGPAITATKTDSFPDPDNDGKAVPGDTITYTVTVTNTGTADATNVVFNDTIDPNTTLVPGSVNTQPIALDDTFTAVGNVDIHPNAAQGLLANDRDPDSGTNTGLTITSLAGDNSAPFAGTSTQGGQVTSSLTDGSFTYNPAPGFTGTDTFTYTITDAGGKTDTATATISVGNGTATPGVNVIWFINSTAAAGGDGRLTSPFNCFVGTNTATQTCFSATAADDPGDAIFLFSGNHTGGYNLFANQKVIGQGATASLATIASVTPPAYSDTLPTTGGASPLITTVAAAPNALVVSAGGILLRGFTVGNTVGAKISGTNFGTLTVGDSTLPDVTLSGGGQALNLTNGAFAATSGFNGVATTSATSAAGILLATVGGAVSFGSTNVSGSGLQGISISGSGVTANFGATTISGTGSQGILIGTTTGNLTFGNTTVTGGTDGVSFQNNSAGTRTFGTLGISGGSGIAFLHATGGNVTVNGAATLSSSGNAIDIQSAAASTAINFASSVSATRTSSGGVGVNLATNNATSTFTFNSLSITTNAGTGLSATGGGTINVTNGTGSINSTPQAAPAIVASGVTLNANFSAVNSTGGANGVSLTNVTGTSNFGTGALSGSTGDTFFVSGQNGTFTYNGTIDSGSAHSVNVTGKTGGTVTFGGKVTDTDTGVTLTSNTGATINFTGGMALNTNANAAFTATGGGTVSATQNNTTILNTLQTTTGTALNVANTTIGASGLTFRSINVTGDNTNPADGIILNNTGVSGGLTISGNGGSCTPALSTCTGGTIQGTGSHGISLTTTSSVVFNLISVHNTGDHGIFGNGVNGFVLRDSRVFNFGNAAPSSGATEDGLHFESTNSANTLAGHGLTGTVIIQRDNIGPDGHFALTPNPPLPENDGITIRNHNDANLNMTVTGTTFTQIGNDGIDAEVTDGPATINVDGSTADGANLFSQLNGRAVNFGDPADNAAAQTLDLTIKNNTFNTVGIGGRWFASARATMNARYNSNTMTSTTNDAIRAESDATNQALTPHATVNATVTNNTMGGGSIFISAHRSALINMAFNNNTAIGGTPSGVGGGLGVHTGINLRSDRGSTLNIDVTGNTGTADGSAAQSQAALDMQVTDNGGGPSTICAKVSGNTFSEVPDAGEQVISIDPVGGTITIEGGPGGSPGTENFLAANNTLNGTNKVAISDPTKVPSGVGHDCVTATPLAPPPQPEIGPATTTASASNATAQPNDITAKAFVSLPQTTKPAKGTTQLAAVAPQVSTDAQPPVSKTEGGAKSSSLKSAQVVVNATAATVSVNIGTLRPNDSVTITFQVTINASIPSNVQQVSNQGTVTADGPISVLTDDPSVGGANDPTVTPVLTPPDIAINDAKAPEPTTGTSTMLFTVTLSHAFPTPVTVNYATADGGANPALGGASCSDPGVDYLTTSGSVNFAAGQIVQTVPVTVCSDADNAETDETLLVNLSGNNTGAIVRPTATGTITTANPAGTLLISELRTSGPGTSGTGDADDDFVELYNNTASPVTVNVADGSGGWGVYKSGAACVDSPVLVGVVPNNTTIPAHGHFLLTGSGYSLSNYPAGNNGTVATTATGDAQLNATAASPNIEADRNVAVFSTANPANISSANRFDAVGFTPANTGANCDLLREGTNLAGAGTGAITAQYSFLRSLTTGTSQDTNNNSADFLVVSTTTSAVGSSTPVLGAPGPENLTSPVLHTTTINSTLIDACQSTSAAPNRVRNTAPYTDPAPSAGSGTGAYPLGTLLTRRKFTNNTGGNVTRLRFRIVDITTAIAPAGIADLRAITTPDTPGVTISAACGGASVTVRGTTLETPPAQPNGGGLNSTLSTGVVSLAQPLAPGNSVNIQFLLGVKQSGSFRFIIIVEALP